MARGELDNKLLDKLVAIVKKEPGNSERFYSEKSGIPMAQILRYLVVAELKADPKLKIPQTPKAVAEARDKKGLRWPRIAARTGLSESKVKELYQEATGNDPSASYTGRGRNFSTSPATTRGSSGRRGTTAGKSSSSTSKAAGSSGRRGAARGNKTATPARGTRGTRGTRAAAGSTDPK